MAIWESARAFLQNVQIDLEMVGRCTIQFQPHPEFLFPKDVLCFFSWRIRRFQDLFLSYYGVGSGEKVINFCQKACEPKLLDGFIICLETRGQGEENQWSSELHVKIDYSGQVPPADVSYVPKEGISHDIHHHKKKLITSKKINLPTGNMFKSENSLRFTFNDSLGSRLL